MFSHSFGVEDAVKFGQEEAVMLNNFRHWVSKNSGNERHFYDGKYWTYNTLEAFQKQFPYWTLKQIRRIVDSLVSQGAIIKGNFSINTYNRTLWYTLANCPNEEIDLPKQSSPSAQMGKCIDNDTDNKPDINTDTPLTPKVRTKKKAKSLQDTTLEDMQTFMKECSLKQGLDFSVIDPQIELTRCKLHFEGKAATIKRAKEWFVRAVGYAKNRNGYNGSAPTKPAQPDFVNNQARWDV